MAIIIVFACAVDKGFRIEFQRTGHCESSKRRVAMCRDQKNIDSMYSLTASVEAREEITRYRLCLKCICM